MAWEQVQKIVGRQSRHGTSWDSYPCVSIYKGGICFNKQFDDIFAKNKKEVMVLIDKEQKLLGFKFPVGEEVTGAYRINRFSPKSVVFHISCITIPKTFPELLGNAYKATLNSGERIVVVSLDPSNKI